MVLGKNENLAVLGQNLTKYGNQGNLMGPDIGIVTNARESYPKADSKLKTSLAKCSQSQIKNVFYYDPNRLNNPLICVKIIL